MNGSVSHNPWVSRHLGYETANRLKSGEVKEIPPASGTFSGPTTQTDGQTQQRVFLRRAEAGTRCAGRCCPDRLSR